MLCLDEKTGSQALERLHPTLPLRPGLVERQEFEYIRHGTVNLFAAFDVSTGRSLPSAIGAIPIGNFATSCGPCAPGPDSRWHLIVDNARYHTKQAVLDWCAAQRPKVTLHWLPAHGSWLNQVEIWFSILSRKCLRRANVRSTQDFRNLIHGSCRPGTPTLRLP